MNYTKKELIAMVYAFGAGGENSLFSSRLYAAKYPDRMHPKVKYFEIFKERFEAIGHIEYGKRGNAKTILTNENQLAFSPAVVENPEMSDREISRDLELSESSVSRSLI